MIMKKEKSELDKVATKKLIDDKYSSRFIELDPKGYFIIKVNHQTNELIVEHFSNNIDKEGLATDPDTGELLGCHTGNKRKPLSIITGRTAKEIGIKLTERNEPLPISKLDHALYIGRELQKAEYSLINGTTYIQD